MQPVVAPSRSSQTRSVFARFRGRFSGNGIFTEVMRLIALRTSSRSAAFAPTHEIHSTRPAKISECARHDICHPPIRESERDASTRSPSIDRRHHPSGERCTIIVLGVTDLPLGRLTYYSPKYLSATWMPSS